MSFRTLVQSGDVQVPVVNITAPAAASSVSGTVSFSATASDNVGVVSVTFRVDGVAIGAADVQAPYSVQWNTTGLADGAHTLTAEARDAANNVGTASIGVVVQNAPVVTSPHHLDFDGADDYLTVADAPDLSFTTGAADRPFSIEMWMRTDSMAKHQLLGKWGESTDQEYRVLIAANTIRADLRDQSTGGMATVFTTSLPAGMIGAWHHLAVTYDGRGGATAVNGITIYVDGVAMPLARINDANYVAMEAQNAPIEIGREGPFWNQYNGALDEIRMWNVARSQAQVRGGDARRAHRRRDRARRLLALQRGRGRHQHGRLAGEPYGGADDQPAVDRGQRDTALAGAARLRAPGPVDAPGVHVRRRAPLVSGVEQAGRHDQLVAERLAIDDREPPRHSRQ